VGRRTAKAADGRGRTAGIGRAPGVTRQERTTSGPSMDLPDGLTFMRLLWALVHGLQTRSKRMRGQLGVTGPQRLVLRVVGLFPGVSAGTLAAILHVHPSTLTGVLQRLVAQGMLHRSAAAGDRRRAVLTLTPRGARVNAFRSGTVEAAIVQGLERVTARDRQSAQRVLSRLADCLNSAGPARATAVRRGTPAPPRPRAAARGGA
jgi:MarR family transcriptional regulator, organic hydroperoxide resistance regulator